MRKKKRKKKKKRERRERRERERDRERERREREERERERERERGGSHAVQLPQGRTHTKPLLSPWRGRGRHSFLFWRIVLPGGDLKLLKAFSNPFWCFFKIAQLRVRISRLKRLEKRSFGRSACYAPGNAPWNDSVGVEPTQRFTKTEKHGWQARLAQSAERKALNLVVVGSSPMVGVFQAGRIVIRARMTKDM